MQNHSFALIAEEKYRVAFNLIILNLIVSSDINIMFLTSRRMKFSFRVNSNATSDVYSFLIIFE